MLRLTTESFDAMLATQLENDLNMPPHKVGASFVSGFKPVIMRCMILLNCVSERSASVGRISCSNRRAEIVAHSVELCEYLGYVRLWVRVVFSLNSVIRRRELAWVCEAIGFIRQNQY